MERSMGMQGVKDGVATEPYTNLAFLAWRKCNDAASIFHIMVESGYCGVGVEQWL